MRPLISLVCPSCGGSLEIPNDIGIAHCMYCGTKIAIQQTDNLRDQQLLQRYVTLCNIAVEAKNYIEALQYCSKILEIDSNNADAWFIKAISTLGLADGAQKYDEVEQYILKVEALAPTDSRTITLHPILAQQAKRRGDEEYDGAWEIWNDWSGNGDPADRALANEKSRLFFIKAMEYYLKAADFEPGNTEILESIATCVHYTGWIAWSETVRAKVKAFEKIRPSRLVGQRKGEK